MPKAIVIARNGKPAARLVPIERKPRRLGLLEGKYPPMDDEAFIALDAEVAAQFGV